MDPELFLLEMVESEECQKIMYKRLAIQMNIGLYYAMKHERGVADPFMIPFQNYVINEIEKKNVDIDALMEYMLENDGSGCTWFSATTYFKLKEELDSKQYLGIIAREKKITPFVDSVDMKAVSLIVIAFVFDNLYPQIVDIREIVGQEVFAYPTNQYYLSKINGADFRKDGLIFDGKGYYYNFFTKKTMIDVFDRMAGFARIIQEEARECDILYRLDERLAMPATEYYDYTGVPFAKFYGPQFRFDGSSFNAGKTVIVHIDNNTMDKLLMVIKKDMDQNTDEEFWHIEIEALPYIRQNGSHVITTFLHGMYYPKRDVFTHIDFTKNQYSGAVYQQKYADSKDGMPIDQYTDGKELHYKIWCIENGKFTRETWYKLMIISLEEKYQRLLNEILE